MTSTTTYNPDGSYSINTTDSLGDVTIQNYSAAGVLLNDTWTTVNGASGSDTFDANGDSSGKTLNADGSYSTYSNDRLGNDRTINFSANGTVLSDTWSDSYGITGTDFLTNSGSSWGGTVNLGNGSVSMGLSSENLTITGGDGSDNLTLGDSTYVVTLGNGNSTLTGGNGNDVVNLGNGNNSITLGNGSDQITVGNGNDTLDVGSGLSTLIGGTGNDIFIVGNTGDVVQAQATGANTIQVSVSYINAANVQTLQGTGSAAIALTGNAIANVITANSGNDTLIAGSGIATLVGGSGNDTFVVNNASDVITEAANSGNNTEQTSVSATLAANVQNLTGTGTAALTLTGNALSGTITGNGANDTLIAGTGSETLNDGGGRVTMIGGSGGGSDTFIVNTIGDVVQDQYTTKNTVQASVNYTVTSNDQTLQGVGSAALTLVGDYATATISANSGNDTLVSGSGTMTLIGGAGNDTFVIYAANDVINAQANAGYNTEQSWVSTTAAANIQNLIGLGNNLTLTGNGQPSMLTANGTNDTLVAGAGLTTMVGDGGYDTFVVNNSSDVINEVANQGYNIEQTAVSTTLAANVQSLIGEGTNNLTLTGNAQLSVITANSGNDTLVAGSGPTTLIGGSGNDTFVLNNPGVVINLPAHAGNDTVVIAGNGASYLTANIVPSTLSNFVITGNGNQVTGNNINNVMTDNGIANVLIAGAGNDTLIGSLYGDQLVGGAGNDTFVLNNSNNTVIDQSNSKNNTVITSFSYQTSSNSNIQNITGTGNANLSLGIGTSLVNGQPVSGNYVITSNNGIDTLSGGFGNNTFIVNNSADSVQAYAGLANNTVNTIDTSVNYNVFFGVQNLTGTGNANLALNDSSNLNEVITSNSGIDTLTGGTGSNTFVINNAADIINMPYQSTDAIVTSVNFNLSPYSNIQSLTGIGNANIALFDNNQLNDVITSNSGVDTLSGGLGINTYIINNSADVISPLYNNVANTVESSVNYVVSGNIQNLTGIGSANIALADTNNLNDVITSNSGIDTLTGGFGNDTFVVNNSADFINLPYNSGTPVDTVDTSVNYTLYSNIQNLTGTGSANLTLVDQNSLNDVITSNSGIDTLIGGSGNDTFVVNNTADIVVTQGNPSTFNTIDSSVNYVLPNNVQDLIMTGTAALTGTANSANDLIVGNSGADTLIGGVGADVLEAGAGATVLNDTNGAGALVAGAGNDTLIAGAQSDFIAAGAGSDSITLGAGTSVVAFNNGDGSTTINAGVGRSNVLSLGEGIAYSNLTLSKIGNNLILNTGTSSITFANWYSGTANQDFVTLQVLEQTASTYSATSTNPLYNQDVEQFNFTQLVNQFNSALANGAHQINWSVMNYLLSDHLSGSNTAALGGDLAYYDGVNGNLTGMSMVTAASTLQTPSFGRTAQAIDPWNGISTSSNKLH